MHARKFAEMKLCVYLSLDPYRWEQCTRYSKPSPTLQKRTSLLKLEEAQKTKKTTLYSTFLDE